MLKSLTNLLLIFMLMLGSMITISSTSWFSMWIGLEINLLSFIPLIYNKKNNLLMSESSINYFLIQTLASMILLFSMILFLIINNTNFILIFKSNYSLLIMIMTLMLKLGAAPFHFWFPNVMEGLNWFNNFMLMTWQKLAPMMILSSIYFNFIYFMNIFIILSTLIGALGGLNQTSLRKLMAFSSINHLGWMFTSMMFNENTWFLYFNLYSFLNLSIIIYFWTFNLFYLNQMYSMFMKSYFLKFFMISSILSLGGLPPFLGFLPKWVIIQCLILLKMYLLNLFMILMSLIIIFYYLKMCFSSLMLNYNELNWNFKNFMNNYYNLIMFKMIFMSIFSLFLMTNLIFMFY